MKMILTFWLILFSLSVSAQESLQDAKIKSLQGKIAPFSVFAKKDSLFLICFWSLSSDESITELNSISANLEHWQSLLPFRFMAVSIDEGKQANRLRPVYNQNSWTFEAYTDLYGDLRKALHSNNLPQSMIVYKNEIIYEQSGWTSGTENYLIQKMLSMKR
jgi:cytochrome c biogenesis protein CcmG, thiol:disulfide interchange protein DsbE